MKMKALLRKTLRLARCIDDPDLIPLEIELRRALAGKADARLTLRLGLRDLARIDDPDLIPLEREIRRALDDRLQIACDIMEIIDAYCF